MAPLGNTAAPADDGNIESRNIHLPMLVLSTPRTETATIGFRLLLGLTKLPQLEHDPEKRKPVFRKDHAQTKS
jgi:hypothetical protein